MTKRLIRTSLIGVVLLGVTACSPAQEVAWWNWHDDDPQAAADWAAYECGDLCTNDTNHNGVVEPDSSSSDAASSSSASDNSDGDVPDEVYPDLGGPCEQWSDAALAAGFTVDQWNEPVARIMYAESRCDPSAYNGASGVTGLMQIMPFWASHCGGSPSDLYDPYFNLRCAHYVYEQQGWGAWVTY